MGASMSTRTKIIIGVVVTLVIMRQRAKAEEDGQAKCKATSATTSVAKWTLGPDGTCIVDTCQPNYSPHVGGKDCDSLVACESHKPNLTVKTWTAGD